MAVFEEAPVWTDEPGPVSGSTPFGLYDNDAKFVADAPNFAKWCARRFGYPVIEVELVDFDFYACYEEAVSDFANQVNQFNIRENRLAVQGMDSGINLTQKTITSTGLNQVIRLSKEYSSEAGAGGKITWRRGSIEVSQAAGQNYDLNQWAIDNVDGKEIEIKRIFHEGRPAVSRYYDPFVETGIARNNLMDEFGWGGWQPAIEYVLFPIYEDLLRVQSVELNDQIRRSAYTFELVNNQLRIFPRPTATYNLWFEYIFVEDRDNDVIEVPSGSTEEEYFQSTGSETQNDFSNINYQEIAYGSINQPGTHWIRKYGLACAKETLGNVRGKYQQIPIPNAEVTLDGDTLRSEAQTEKENLIQQLRETLEDASMQSQWEKKTAQEEAMINSLKNVPFVHGIYIA
jgi:hypothetical protein